MERPAQVRLPAPLAAFWQWQIAVTEQALAWQALAMRGWTTLATLPPPPAAPVVARSVAAPPPSAAPPRAARKPAKLVVAPDETDVDYIA